MQGIAWKQHTILFMAVAWSLVVSSIFPAISPAETDVQGHVLLIGCTIYPTLPEEYWLVGAENDVNLMYGLLTEELFHFKSEQITTLAGWPDDEARRPTRVNIEREFTRLSEIAQNGDQVVIFLAGHGSQQPANDDPKDVELDGFDEIFLPADIGTWNGSKQRVENAITDDELREWVSAIRNTGAFMWIIVDACHSGTMIRGAERERYVPPEMLIPEPLVEAAREQTIRRSRNRGETAEIDILGFTAAAAGDIVAMYATQASETEPEKLFEDRWHGLFTHTLAETLLQSASMLTYRELVERVNIFYRGRGRTQPTPLIEGGSPDREILGIRDWPERPKILLGEKIPNLSGVFELKMGSVHGLSPGSILLVYPPAGTQDADMPTGHVQIVNASSFTSQVTPVEFNNMPVPGEEQLLPGSRCKVVFVDYGDFRIKIAVEPSEIIETALSRLAADHQFTHLVERVTNATDAEWVLRIIHDQVYLIPASGLAVREDIPSQFKIGNSNLSSNDLVTQLRDALIRIARATNLMEIATKHKKARHPEAVDVKVELLRFKDVEDQKGKPVPYRSAGRILREGDIIGFQITNPTPYPIDVTLLFVDSGYGIRPFFPDPRYLDDNRIPPGKTLMTPMAEITGETFGNEQLVTIAVKAEAERIDFSCLGQPTLAEARAKDVKRAMGSPLGQLLEAAIYAEDERELEDRGMPARDLDNYSLHLLNWRTVPAN